jgi:hypothetical protein
VASNAPKQGRACSAQIGGVIEGIHLATRYKSLKDFVYRGKNGHESQQHQD